METLREYLDTLRASAIADDASTFDPTGTSNGALGLKAAPDRSTSEGWDGRTESGVSKSDDTDLTNLSHDLSATSLKDVSPPTVDAFDDFDTLDIGQKEKQLNDLFPSQTLASISYTLKKCNGNFGQAMDILLNHVYFDESTDLHGEEKVQSKGIDAFDEALNPRGRRKKGKNKHKRFEFEPIRSSSESPASTSANTPNHWKSAARDIDFLSEKTGMSQKTVSSLYHKNGASIKATVQAIVEQHLSLQKDKELDDPIIVVNIATLAEDFPALPPSYASALVQITYPSTAHAHELAKAMTVSSWTDVGASSGKIIPQYAPINLDDSVDDHGPNKKALSTPSSGRVSPVSAVKLSALRSNAFDSASNYHRKAGSDRLFGAAAAYYGQLGRDYHSQLRAASAAEADALVESNSTADSLDLHGVSVQDAVRITEREVDRWWQHVRTKEARTKSERVGNGFAVVTGRGSHSKDGKGRIGPAVARMLVRNGWKVEIGSGLLVVTGRLK